MNCPKCGSKMEVSKSIQAGGSAKTQHLECSNPKCGTTCTAVTVFINVNPGYGEGALKLAQKIKANNGRVPKLRQA